MCMAPRTVPGAESALKKYLMLITSCPHFMDEEAEAQKLRACVKNQTKGRHSALIQTEVTLL